MFIRKAVFIGIICMLGLTGCATNTKSGAEGGGDKRAEELLSMSRSELAKQESYTIEMEKQEETSSKSEKVKINIGRALSHFMSTMLEILIPYI